MAAALKLAQEIAEFLVLGWLLKHLTLDSFLEKRNRCMFTLKIHL